MITGIHAVVFSPEAEKVRGFFADVLGCRRSTRAAGGPSSPCPPAELAVHPDGGRWQQLYLMCDDIRATLAEMESKGVEVTQQVADQRWGLLAAIRMPDGSDLPIYQPRHPSPHPS